MEKQASPVVKPANHSSRHPPPPLLRRQGGIEERDTLSSILLSIDGFTTAIVKGNAFFKESVKPPQLRWALKLTIACNPSVGHEDVPPPPLPPPYMGVMRGGEFSSPPTSKLPLAFAFAKERKLGANGVVTG